ncbi:amidohydrolase family [Fusarium acutatum]|uniref:Amidohydrolase family n=1 Tax=Fusarium acutatum TaxID=78861 RepID=A0A8H4JMY9_9HYPO|nr:amidohydrolase family [Fusarium acutatum]
MSNIPRIDVHHHIIPPQLQGPSTRHTTSPPAIYSVSTPGVTHIADPEESAKVARAMNEYSASLRDANPKNDFFATVPSLQHTDLVLEELGYAFDTLKADGVTFFISYASP